MLYQICNSVHVCHSHKVIHRDLKPENILLDSKRQIKIGIFIVVFINIQKLVIGDFGVARKLNRSSVAKTFCGKNERINKIIIFLRQVHLLIWLQSCFSVTLVTVGGLVAVILLGN